MIDCELKEFGMLERIEYSVFFPVVRFIAFIGSAILLLAVIAGFIFYVTTGSATSTVLQGMGKRTVTFSELQANIHPEDTQVTIPQNIQRRLDENTSQVLENWLNSFGTASEKNDFLKNLSQVISEAERKDPENIDKYINNFRNLYMENIREKAMLNENTFGIPDLVGQAVDQYISPLVTRMVRSAIVIGILLLFTLFVITVSFLSLLSIERNTR